MLPAGVARAISLSDRGDPASVWLDPMTCGGYVEGMNESSRRDEKWMERCLELARKGAGQVSPNPMVGCVIVDPEGNVLGKGAHLEFGEAHAERHALREVQASGAGGELNGCSLYVNLEPCSHEGKTPPCVDAILEAGIGRVVVGMEDPFPMVAGRGVRRLREAGVQVDVGVLEPACSRFNEAFVHHVRTGRPLVTLKVAQTLDGQVATKRGDSKWVTGPAARTLVHRWRSELDAVLVGSGTARHDDPRLTVRHVDGRQPVRVVLDRLGALNLGLQLFSDGFVHKTVVMVGEDRAAPRYADVLVQSGGKLVRIPETADNHLDLEAVLELLGGDGGPAEQPIQSVMVEAGPGLATAFVEQDLVDRYFCFLAPKVLGLGTPVVGDLGLEEMAEAITFESTGWEQVGEDMLMRGYRRSM